MDNYQSYVQKCLNTNKKLENTVHANGRRIHFNLPNKKITCRLKFVNLIGHSIDSRLFICLWKYFMYRCSLVVVKREEEPSC